ncbi:hypothetical protein V5O48_011845 [Marasmius crinis-equi]|uniref:Uncharacterized protein n=1 Tax=Marasmius crinis-equi TaxID=585013 RepID=A0ABR3F4G4_9AGAR
MPPTRTLAGQITQQGLKAATLQLMGIYPTLLIVLIYLQRSLWDTSGNSTISSSPKTVKSNGTGYNGSGTTLAEKSHDYAV